MSIDNLFYCKTVLGQHRNPFTIYKLRTMAVQSDISFLDLSRKNGFDGLGKIKDDPRITFLGKLLRPYHLDELPQIFNLVSGEMSLVGVRPKTREEWEVYPQYFMAHALMYKPGLFPACYYYTDIETFEDKIEIEKEYLRKKELGAANVDKLYFRRIITNILSGEIKSR